MNHQNQEKLAVFSRDRYHDWSLIFVMMVIILTFGFAYNASLYINVREIVTNKPQATLNASRFERLKEQVTTVEIFFDTQARQTQEITVPRDPSLR